MIKSNLRFESLMKKSLLSILILLAVFNCHAHHIIGGEMFYNYIGKGTAPGTSKYLITLKIFRDQNSPPGTAPMPTEVYIGIFNNDNGQQFKGPYPYYVVPINSEFPVKINPLPPCINNAPNLSYHVGVFLLNVQLPDNTSGYSAAFQTCCRVDNIANVTNINGNETGSTFSCSIPPAIYADNSPEFATSIDVICGLKPFSLQFNAIDQDGDSLVYSFAPAYDGGSFKDAQNGNPSPPPYSSVSYENGFTSSSPLGQLASIDSKTGIISGIAPATGKYVLCVQVFSYRKGIRIDVHRKDFIINVSDCNFAGAQLNPKPVICDSFNVAFTNNNASPLNVTFLWNFGDPSTGISDTSTLASPNHIYSDTGVYIYKLVVNPGQQCRDSMTQIVKVYPGFIPGFSADGKCINSSIFFTDKTTTSKNGSVTNWSWNFGDPLSTSNTSSSQDTSHIYTTAGNYPVQLTASSSKGCLKTITDTILIKTKPDFSVNNDTLICSIDTLQLTSIGSGSVSWTPGYNIIRPNSFNPLVYPKTTTIYYATLVESRGCIATDSVLVNVVSRVTLNLIPDTTICLTDTANINTMSDGLHYLWSPANTVINDTAKYAQVVPIQTTTYHVISKIGKCSTAGNITVRTVPYPLAKAEKDTTLCFPASFQLHASGGSIYNWTPPNFLNNPTIANPISSPQESIQYTVQVNDVLGCPKPTFDSVIIKVEKPIADAGPRDTSIVVNQPLQLNGSGAEFYLWSPANGLNNPNIANPVALLSESQQYVLTVETLAGCTATDTINITVYKVKPDFYVPDAFTPNGDRKNDLFRPILIGMKSLRFFKVYNRLGQLVYSTYVQKQGWDGTFKGEPQDAAIFVWMAEGEDYLGKIIFKKGVVALIR